MFFFSKPNASFPADSFAQSLGDAFWVTEVWGEINFSSTPRILVFPPRPNQPPAARTLKRRRIRHGISNVPNSHPPFHSTFWPFFSLFGPSPLFGPGIRTYTYLYLLKSTAASPGLLLSSVQCKLPHGSLSLLAFSRHAVKLPNARRLINYLFSMKCAIYTPHPRNTMVGST